MKRRKFGTASAYDDYVFENATDEIPKKGDYSVILNSHNDAVCIIRDYDVYIRAFGDVSSFHAYSEGEGDRTLEYWKEVHTRVFGPDLEKEGMPLTDESLIVCEKFTVEYVPGEEPMEDDELMFVEPTMEYAGTSYFDRENEKIYRTCRIFRSSIGKRKRLRNKDTCKGRGFSHMPWF